MPRILFITGTGTDIGKTGLSLSVLAWARSKGLKAAYLKPVQCGPRGDAEWIQAALPTNSAAGALHQGAAEASAVYTFADAVSPHLAAERAGVWIDPDWIVEQAEAASRRCDLLVIEGSGGAAVPLNRDGLSLADVATKGQWSTLIAAQPGLGTLHHTLTTNHFLRARGVTPVGFAMVQSTPTISPVLSDNIATLQEMAGLSYFGIMPHCPGLGKRLPLSPAVAALLAQSLPGLDTWWARA